MRFHFQFDNPGSGSSTRWISLAVLRIEQSRIDSHQSSSQPPFPCAPKGNYTEGFRLSRKLIDSSEDIVGIPARLNILGGK